MFLPGTLFLIDTSAAQRMHVDKVRDTIIALTDQGLAATCVTVDLEAAFSARKPADVARIFADRAEYLIQLDITETIAQRARQVMTLLAQRDLHRAAGPIDVLTAAIAEHHRAIVLHYDTDFEHIASITGQRQQWIAPRGSIS